MLVDHCFKMAAKMKTFSNVGRKICNPVISTDVMGNRNVEVRPVGAWVQTEDPNPQNRHEAVLAAQLEECKIQSQQKAKEERLRQFQEDVKKRVRALDRQKKQAQVEKMYKAHEMERNVVRQSAFMSDHSTSRKDCCSVRAEDLSIRADASNGPQAGHANNIIEERKNRAFHDQTNQVRKFTHQARRNLVSRKVISDEFIPDNLPGGVWKISGTLDGDIILHPASRYTEEPAVINLEDDDGTEEISQSDEEKGENEAKAIHFDNKIEDRVTQEQKINQKSRKVLPVQRLARVPNIYPGPTEVDDQRQLRSQKAMYRRLFMDIEREQVQENKRRAEHRKKIAKLKREKELQREHDERLAQKLVEPQDPVTGEYPADVMEREQQKQAYIRQTIKEHEDRMRKARETERYVGALRRNLREKIAKRGIQLPPLCCCGETVWDSNPDTCANNCIFYKNPKGYAQALQSLLLSCDVT